MNIIGKTEDGKMTILAIENDELEQLKVASARLAAIRGIVAGAEVNELVPVRWLEQEKQLTRQWKVIAIFEAAVLVALTVMELLR